MSEDEKRSADKGDTEVRKAAEAIVLEMIEGRSMNVVQPINLAPLEGEPTPGDVPPPTPANEPTLPPQASPAQPDPSDE